MSNERELIKHLTQSLASELDDNLCYRPIYWNFMPKKEQKLMNDMIDLYQKIPKKQRIDGIINYFKNNKYE